MTTHDMIHKIKWIALQLIEAKSYSTSAYAQSHLCNAIVACEVVATELGEKLREEQSKGEERV